MQILLLGKNGQLGWELQRSLAPLGPLTALDYDELNLEDFEAVRQTIRSIRPQVIVNASAYTAVDKAESEPERAFAINATIPGILAEEALALKAALIHFSTDYVFDGTKGAPYTEEDRPNPLSVYGQSKLAGEQAIQAMDGDFLIFRTAWVYSTRQGGFVTKALQWARQNETLRIVDDQISNPTWARMLAQITSLVLARGNEYISPRRGLYHLAGAGFTSRFEWTQMILSLDPNKHEHKLKELLPALTADFPTPAQRPLFSALDSDTSIATFGLRMPAWQAGLRMAMERAG